METRTKVAAAAASVIPFSCVICFDEFNSTDRPPMVLPCGHTYVCLSCTKRLKRCMECREPLFIPAARHSASSNNNNNSGYPSSSAATGRFSPGTQQPSTPTKQSKPVAPTIPLPIPKNVVLLALMEAAERQQSKPKEKNHHPHAHPYDEALPDDEDETDDEEEAYNLDHIITGMATLSGPCGTYAVRDRDGLPLYAEDPRVEPEGPPESVMLPEIPTEPTNSLLDEEKKQDELILEVGSADQQDDHVVNFVIHHNPSMMMESRDILLKGQKVQVVSFEDGVAKLARGKGFVRATSRQLVKVGGPMDEACRLEGLLDTVRSRGHDLQKTLEENNDIEEKILQQLEEAQAREPAQPVITDPPAPEIVEPPTVAPRTPETPLTPPLQRCVTTPDKLESSPVGHLQPREQFYTPRTDLGRYLQGTRRAPHSPASIDNSDIMMLPGPAMPRYGSSVSFEEHEQENHQPLGGGFSCGVALSLEGAEEFIHRPRPSTSSWSRPHFRSAASGSSAGDSSLTPSLTSSFDGVDFRTGLSGHRGLSHARKLHNSPTPRAQIRMMGEHRGIAHIRARRDGGHGTPTSTSSTVTILENSPTFVTTTSRPHSAIPALGPRFSTPGSSS